MEKALTYGELMELAKKHYNDGGDYTFECMDEMMFNEYVRMFGPITEQGALEMFRIDKDLHDDIANTAW